jgi:hypothetical protein
LDGSATPRQDGKRPYAAPQIVDYGTVRALGSGGPGGDYQEEEFYDG